MTNSNVRTALALALIALPSAAAAQTAQEDFDANCAACHSIGGGRQAGPDLKGLSQRRSREWIIKFVSDPDKMVQSGDPVATRLVKEFDGEVMPEIPDMTVQRVEAYIKLIDERSGVKAPATAPAAAPAEPAGDPARGRGLFSGALPLKNGGPSCFSCHAAAGLPWPGGGTLGPDLTGAAARLGGPKAMASWLASPPSPTMRTIYGRSPMIPLEESDLAAYLVDAAKQGASAGPGTKPSLLAAGAGGAGLMLVVFGALWRRRLGARRGRSEDHDG